MIVLAGTDLVLPDRVPERGALVIDSDQIIEIAGRAGRWRRR
jgi:hypothetical protein